MGDPRRAASGRHPSHPRELADVELPNHVRFTQYVFWMRRCAMTVALDDAGERVLLMRRHRFIVDRWVWELPGAYMDDGEDPATGAAREVEEETGWRLRGIEFVMSSQRAAACVPPP
jgi:8-oxo-dGTP pyrophosphatase MutT (NUDIX family)